MAFHHQKGHDPKEIGKTGKLQGAIPVSGINLPPSHLENGKMSDFRTCGEPAMWVYLLDRPLNWNSGWLWTNMDLPIPRDSFFSRGAMLKTATMGSIRVVIIRIFPSSSLQKWRPCLQNPREKSHLADQFFVSDGPIAAITTCYRYIIY